MSEDSAVGCAVVPRGCPDGTSGVVASRSVACVAVGSTGAAVVAGGAADLGARVGAVGSAGSVGVREVRGAPAEGVAGAVVPGACEPFDGDGVEEVSGADGEDVSGDADPVDPDSGGADPGLRESPVGGLGLGTGTTAESPLPSPLPTSRSNPFPLCRASTSGIFVIGPSLCERATTTVTSMLLKPSQ
ncbi:hypothetical protein ACMATS_33145 [Streptoverticillium reticulum]|uniref:hypothetical protein n=1 Tax=Streptoverticillium reticulum TaxID=1433415 RepID=UPI0039BF7EFE